MEKKRSEERVSADKISLKVEPDQPDSLEGVDSSAKSSTPPGSASTSGEITDPISLEESVSNKSLLPPGTRIAGKYEIVGHIGAGGMGIVYKARDSLLAKFVAIKVLSERSQDPVAWQRFQREARAAGRLCHQKLIPVHELGVTESGHPYMVMDFAEGRSLADVLTEERSLDTNEAVYIFRQICEGMAYAHNEGVLHRDLKPSNIMLRKLETQRPEVKVVDFGIAKILDKSLLQSNTGDQSATSASFQGAAMQRYGGLDGLTQSGDIFGSPSYISPEQAMGKPADERSDIYSLACLMYETLTGERPFQGDSILETMCMRIHNDPPSLSAKAGGKEFSPDLEGVVHKALARDPKDRYQSMDELSAALLNCISDKKTVPIHSNYAGFLVGAVAIVILAVSLPFVLIKRTTGNASQVSFSRPHPQGTEIETSSANQISNPEPHRQKGDTVIEIKPAEGLPDTKDRIVEARRYDLDLVRDGTAYDGSLPAAIRHMHAFSVNLNDGRGVSQWLRLLAKSKYPVEGLNLTGTVITDSDMKQIASMTRLHDLRFIGTPIPQHGLNQLGTLKELKLLIVEGVHLSPKGLAVLGKFPALKYLKLTGCDLTDENLAAITKAGSLTNLKLGRNRISESGLHMLISNLHSLRELGLDHTSITDASLEALDYAGAPPIERLYLVGNNITGAGVNHLTKIPLRELQLGQRCLSHGCVLSISKLKHLTKLRVPGSIPPALQGELRQNLNDKGLIVTVSQFVQSESDDRQSHEGRH